MLLALGVATPIAIDSAAPEVAVAQYAERAQGTFVSLDGDTSVELFDSPASLVDPEPSYNYIEHDLDRDAVFTLEFGEEARTWVEDRHVYVWYRSEYRYFVAWQPADPAFIRVTLIDPNGVQIFNELFERE